MSKTILLVEDDYLDVESVKRAFKKLSVAHRLITTHTGADALNLLTAEKDAVVPDLILLDINMPKMNGLEFLGIIRNYHRLRSIKIFIITTSSEEYDRSAAENLGISGYLVKPLNFDSKDASIQLLKKELES